MKIYLKTHFYQESEMPFLKINFLEGYKFFDKFIICEFNYSKTGIKKDFIDLNKHNIFSEEDYKKIEYHKIDLENEIKPAFDNNKESLINMKVHNEGLFRNYFTNLKDFEEDDIIISVDADEIIYESFYKKILNDDIKFPSRLKMHNFHYKITNLCEGFWSSAIVTKYKNSKDYYQTCSQGKVKFPNWRDEGEVTKDYCGCHFSWCFDNESIKNKIKYHGVGVNQNSEESDSLDIEKKIKNKEFTKGKNFRSIKFEEKNRIYPKSMFFVFK